MHIRCMAYLLVSLLSFLCEQLGFIYAAKELPLGVEPILFLGVMGLNTHPDPFLLLVSISKYAGVSFMYMYKDCCIIKNKA